MWRLQALSRRQAFNTCALTMLSGNLCTQHDMTLSASLVCNARLRAHAHLASATVAVGLQKFMFHLSSRPWGFEFLHAYISWEYWLDYYGSAHNSACLDTGFETLNLDFFESKLWELTALSVRFALPTATIGATYTPELTNVKFHWKMQLKPIRRFQYTSTGKATTLWIIPPSSKIMLEDATETNWKCHWNPRRFLRCWFLVCKMLPLTC